ncbi:hypothetical protein [Mucilaginibacter myungsuensis]|uniref:Uncharacterized protein n=1 Tax=Mucilaginibacter myungsuensis TaxID=649104 RepID=A0A929L0L5_9SPHI|nr:hypothetical protein [Mucilaginibacter myungsuensis]MBE9664052.1 hypothetical protein [Mucilaginibacter myungsuensis]MDN3601230.1 hypothetical protein [Mucilaginibacter myungsuensis]
MKKIFHIAILCSMLTFAACGGSPKTGGAEADSGSHGSSGAADTLTNTNGTGTSASSNGSSDTSKAKILDTSRQEKH